MRGSISSCDELDVLVQLVDAGVDRAELDHLGADLDDEARIRGAAGGGELGGAAGVLLACLHHGLREPPALAEERLGAERPVDRVFEAVLLQDRSTRCFQGSIGAFGGEAEVEVDFDRARNHVGRAGAGVDVGDLEAGRRKALVALVPLRLRQLGERRGEQVHGVLHEVRVGDVALDAAHHELAGERAAAAVLQHVAERSPPRSARRRCSSRSARCGCFSVSTTRTVPSTAGPSSSEVRRSAIEPEWPGRSFTNIFGGDDEGGDRGLHVRGAAAVELAVADGRHERIGVPLGERAGRHDVGVAGEADHRAGAAAPRPEVGDVAELHRLALEAGAREPLRR